MFADATFRRDLHLSAVNSINWARIAAQIPYYVAAALALGAPEREVAFAVPTGNFGNVLAAWAARRMGLPVARLTVASNRNDILTRFLDANDMSVRAVEPSLSPSMDIGVSSNFERLLFELLGRDAGATAAAMRASAPPAGWTCRTTPGSGHARCSTASGWTMPAPRPRSPPARGCGYLADPHTAIGIAAARAHPCRTLPTIAAATAHPAKFPDAMRQATGAAPLCRCTWPTYMIGRNLLARAERPGAGPGRHPRFRLEESRMTLSRRPYASPACPAA